MKEKIAVALLLSLILSACGGQAAPSPTASEIPMTWKEQYDLGVRYLSEGNYEEAVIAFAAAIEIEPKRLDAYVGLADAYIGLGDYEKASQAIEDGRNNCGEEYALTRVESSINFLRSGDEGIRITDFYFDKETYCKGEETDFLVSVAYHCPENEECILMIGANTTEPDFFAIMDEDYAVTGSGSYQFSVSVEPMQWDNADFGMYVNLSEAAHGEEWTPFGSDVLYIDREGNMKGWNDSEDTRNYTKAGVGSLGLENVATNYESNGNIIVDNDGAVGGMNIEADVVSPANVYTVRIATWYEESPDQEEINHTITRMVDRWKTDWSSDQHGERELPFHIANSHPVDEDELGKTLYVLLVGLDEDCNSVGYALVTEQVPG